MSWSVDNKLACSLVTTAKDPSHMSERFEHFCMSLVTMLSVLITVELEIFAMFIFRLLHDLTKFAKVYPANLFISQYKRIIPACKSRN